MTVVMTGEAMPTNLTEALELDASMEEHHLPDDEAFISRYLSNWTDIYSGKFPIRSTEEATALLAKMAKEAQHSSGDFVEGIVRQIYAFVADASVASVLENAV